MNSVFFVVAVYVVVAWVADDLLQACREHRIFILVAIGLPLVKGA